MKEEELNMNIFNAEWKKQQAKNTHIMISKQAKLITS